MATIYEHQVYVVVSSAAAGAIVTALDTAFPCDDGSKRDSAHPEYYASKFSANGQDPVSHYGAAFVITEAKRQAIEAAGLNTAPGVTYWRTTNPGGILTLTNHAGSQVSVGQSWTWDNCLTAISLQPILPPKS